MTEVNLGCVKNKYFPRQQIKTRTSFPSQVSAADGAGLGMEQAGAREGMGACAELLVLDSPKSCPIFPWMHPHGERSSRLPDSLLLLPYIKKNSCAHGCFVTLWCCSASKSEVAMPELLGSHSGTQRIRQPGCKIGLKLGFGYRVL